MKCQIAIKSLFSAFLLSALFFSYCAQARIENTVIANYDLASGKNSHYELLVSPGGAETTVTVLPLGRNDTSPSIFKASTCINRYAGTAKQGEFRFTAAETDKNDVRLSNIGYFVNEHNLSAWWIRLNDKQNLMFNEDVGSLMVTDASSFNGGSQLCPLD